MEHIYGAETSDRRNTVFYMHMTPDNLDPILGSQPNLSKAQESNEANKQQIEYEQIHGKCEKNLVYFTSRFAIIYSVSQTQQRFYSGHKLKISAVAKHPH